MSPRDDQSALPRRTVLLFVALSCVAIARADDAPRFPHPDRIRFDGQCFTINGQDTFIYSGAFHYFRCPKPLWRDRFRKIKEAGFNTVETYVAWNWHERQPPAGLKDFSKIDLADFEDWLKMALDEFGLHVIARPGPYICAEWAGGGFPHWLMLEKPARGQVPSDSPPSETATKPKEPVPFPWIRSDDPTFLAWSRHWYDAVCPLIAKYQITRRPVGKPGVILFQIENEYDYMNQPDDVKSNHLKALAEAAWAGGIDVPVFTCWSKQVRGSRDPVLSRVIDACNEYPGWNVENVRQHLDALRKAQPHAPLMVPELQGGWFSELGGLLAEDQDGITPAQTNHVTLFAIQNGLTALNYYMLFGGTNFGDWADDVNTTTYDYNAAIRECGGVGEKYRVVQAIGTMLREHGSALARSQPAKYVVEGAPPDVEFLVRLAANGDRYVFARNRSRKESHSGRVRLVGNSADKPSLDISYELAPFDAKVFFVHAGGKDAAAGEWLPKRHAPPTAIATPPPIRITQALRHDDDGGSQWRSVRLSDSLASLGIFDCRFVVYRATFALTPGAIAQAKSLWIKPLSRSGVSVRLNGRSIHPTGTVASHPLYDVGKSLSEATNDLHVLYENPGYSKWGAAIEDLKGLADVRLTPARSPDIVLDRWRVNKVDGVDNRPEIATAFDDSAWQEVTLSPGSCPGPTNEANSTSVLRTAFDLSAETLAAGQSSLEFDCIDDHGWIYVNGKKLGEAHDWNKRHAFDAAAQLHAGRNIVAVILKNDQGPGGLTQPVRLASRLPDGMPLQWELSAQLSGVAGGWFKENLDDTGWTKLALDRERALDRKHSAHSVKDLPRSATDTGTPIATWYRMTYAIPATPGKWVPWRITLDASGNGFIYLNGHALGRYWEVGPQREYYLPECWLNVGPGKSNVLTLCLRPTEHGAMLRAAEVAPYAEFAEFAEFAETR